MAKQVTAVVKLQCPGGQATPAPPVGPALGAHGVNIGMFVKQFNEKTGSPEMKGLMTGNEAYGELSEKATGPFLV